MFLLLLLSSSEPTNLGESFRAIFLPHFTILLWKKITTYPLHLNKASDVGEKLIFILWNGYMQFCLYISHQTVRFYRSYCLHPSIWIELHKYQPKTSLISQSLMVPHLSSPSVLSFSLPPSQLKLKCSHLNLHQRAREVSLSEDRGTYFFVDG